MPPVKKVTLDQLDDGTRAALKLELMEEQKDAEAAKAAAANVAGELRNRATAGLLDDRDHLRGCPGGRVESYASVRPARPADAIPKADVTVVRCVECGGSTVLEQPYPVTVAQIDQAVERLRDAGENVGDETETEEVA